MLYDEPSGASAPFIPPSPSPESVVQPLPAPTDDGEPPSSRARRPQISTNYPYYPPTSYNTTPFIPPLPSPESVVQPLPVPTDDGEPWAHRPQTPTNYPYYPSTPYNTTPFIPPLPFPESVVQPLPVPTDDGEPPSSWARRPQTPTNYPYYPSTPYNTTPFIPPMPGVHSIPATQSRPNTPGSYFPAPLPLPRSPDIAFDADFTEYPTSLSGTPWAHPPPMPPPSAPAWPHSPAAAYNAYWTPPQGTPRATFDQPLPAPASPLTLGPVPLGPANFRWTNNTDRVNPFAEGPHYGPVLEPFLAKVVDASITLNPLLVPPSDAPDDHLRWNMLFRTSNCCRTTEPQRSWVSGRDAPSTHPRLTHMRIVSRAFPWMIHARARDPKLGVTCAEVLDAISTCMYEDVAKKEYEHLPPARERQIRKNYRFNRSTDHNTPGGRLGEGLKRLDWLGKVSKFGGLVASDAFVKEHCGDVLPCTFELKCLPSYPLTLQEAREQEEEVVFPVIILQ